MITNLTINGMHCKACKQLIESDLSDLEGIKNISVDLANASALVEHDEEQINQQLIIEKITELGYQANLK
jgi:Cu+-exporting ATPase